MPRAHSPFPAQYRNLLIELVRAGRSPEALAREFEPTAQSIRNWVAQADRDAGRRSDGLTTAERGGFRRLRRENRRHSRLGQQSPLEFENYHPQAA